MSNKVNNPFIKASLEVLQEMMVKLQNKEVFDEEEVKAIEYAVCLLCKVHGVALSDNTKR